jgi:hypothetical protein
MMLLFTAFWLPALAIPGLTPVIVVVGIGLVTYQIVTNIKSSSQPFGTAPYVDEVNTKKGIDSSYSKFVETENSPKPKVEGEQKTGENATKAGKGSGVPRGREKVLGFPAPDSKYGGTLNDTQTTSSTALVDTDNPNFYQNRDPLAGLIQIRKRRLLDKGFAVLTPTDTPVQSEGDPNGDNNTGTGNETYADLNPPLNDVERDKWIPVNNPSPLATIGQMQIQPLLNTTLTLRSAPTTGEEIAVFDPSEIVNAVNTDNSSE